MPLDFRGHLSRRHVGHCTQTEGHRVDCRATPCPRAVWWRSRLLRSEWGLHPRHRHSLVRFQNRPFALLSRSRVVISSIPASEADEVERKLHALAKAMDLAETHT